MDLYHDLQAARRELAEFALHDGRPGSSNSKILDQRGIGLKQAQDNAMKVQLNAAKCLTFLNLEASQLKFTASLTSPWIRSTFLDIPNNIGLQFQTNQLKRVEIFNSLGWERGEMVSIEIELVSSYETAWFQVFTPNGKYVSSQVSH